MPRIHRPRAEVLAEVLLMLGLLGAGPACRALENITLQWEVEIGRQSGSSPAIGDDGTICFGADDGRFWGLTRDGLRKWVFRARGEIRSSPALAPDGTAYFGCRDRKLYAVGAGGEKKWEFKTGAWVDSSPALASDGTVYFGSWDKNFYALAPGGALKWKFETQGEIVCSPAVGLDGTIYFGAHDRKFYALGPDGAKRWEFKTGGSIISSPALNGTNGLYFTSVDGNFYALGCDGRLRWRLKTGGITESSPVIGPDGTLYVGVNDTVWAIATDGTKHWEQTTPWHDFFYEAAPLVLADGSVCHISRYGMLMNVESQQHNLKWMYPPGYGHTSPAVGSDGTIYVGFLRVGFDGFGALRTHIPLAHSAWPKFRGNLRNTGNERDNAR